MATSKLDRACAAANLLNMGFAADRICPIIEQWSERQSERSLRNLSSYARRLEVSDRMPPGGASRLFVSFHYSSYAHLYRSVASRSTGRAIASLIGEQSDTHQEKLISLAGE